MASQMERIEKVRKEDRPLVPYYERAFRRSLVHGIASWIEQGRPRKR
ncbi:MAG: hypothetical protein IJ111_02200 [Eggerthellaceae bacterium]|nr:hypothetical protein [Eggerthellaceae bacterium]